MFLFKFFLCMFEFSCKIKRFVRFFFSFTIFSNISNEKFLRHFGSFLIFLFNLISVLEYIQFKILKGFILIVILLRKNVHSTLWHLMTWVSPPLRQLLTTYLTFHVLWHLYDFLWHKILCNHSNLQWMGPPEFVIQCNHNSFKWRGAL